MTLKTTTPARWAPNLPAFAPEATFAPPAPLASRLGLLRRRHGLAGPLARTVAALAYGEGRA